MSAWRTEAKGSSPSRADLEKALRDEGLEARWWSNTANYRYGRHDHPYHKVLYCVSGSIVFETDDGDHELFPGDRLDVEPLTPHAATVGPEGVECVEASSDAVRRLPRG